jgi:hypothetical protein
LTATATATNATAVDVSRHRSGSENPARTVATLIKLCH